MTFVFIHELAENSKTFCWGKLRERKNARLKKIFEAFLN